MARSIALLGVPICQYQGHPRDSWPGKEAGVTFGNEIPGLFSSGKNPNQFIENDGLVLRRAVDHMKDNQQAIIGEEMDRTGQGSLRSLTTDEHGIMSLAGYLLESWCEGITWQVPWHLAVGSLSCGQRQRNFGNCVCVSQL